MTESAKNIDEIIKDSSHRATKKTQFLIGERYHLHIGYNVVENLQYLLESLCLMTLERGETPIVYCPVRGKSL